MRATLRDVILSEAKDLKMRTLSQLEILRHHAVQDDVPPAAGQVCPKKEGLAGPQDYA
jgi:hypothetical protein